MISKLSKIINSRVSYKFFITLFIFILIISCLITTYFYQIEKKTLTQTLITNGTLLTNIFASNARLGVFSESQQLLDNSIEGIIEQEFVLSVHILKLNGHVLKYWSRNRSQQHDRLQEFEEVPIRMTMDPHPFFKESAKKFEFWAPVRSRDKYPDDSFILFGKNSVETIKTTIGYVKIEIDKKKLKNKLKKLLIKIILAWFIFLLIGSIFFLILIEKMVSPLKRLTNGVNQLGKKGIFGNIPVETRNEIGKLAIAFNNMSAVLKTKEQALRESEEKYRLIVENTADVIIITNRNGNVTYISPACKKVWGFEPEYFLNKRFWDIIYEKNEKAKMLHERALKGETGPISDWRTLTKTGEIKFMSQTFSHIIHNGKIQNIIYVLRDITEKKKLRKESELRLQQIIQADKLASLGEVVAGVAHEINNPNSFIAYNIPVLEETWNIFKPVIDEYASRPDNKWDRGNISFKELSQDITEIIESLKISSKRINNVVNNLKDFAKLDESNNLKTIKINDVIKRALSIVGSQLKKSAVKIEVDYSPNLPVVQGHFQKLEQVVINLLVNASNAIQVKEKGKISVSTKYSKTHKSAIIEVEDNGIGIIPENVDRLFEPFFTTRRNEGGTGLGLSVSYGLVQEHNGIIGVLTKPGIGSRFSIYLPLDMKTNLNIRPTILCIDSNEKMLNKTKSYLTESENLSVDTLSNPENVLEHIKNRPDIDIILCALDFENNLLDGWHILKKLKTKHPLIHMIMYMKKTDEGHNIKNSFKPDHILHTPFEINRLSEVLKKIGRQKL